MRIRFSLRTIFILLTLLACSCYLWLTRPSQVAQRFAHSINTEDYQAADRLLPAGDEFLVKWADKRWAFKASGEVRPLTFAQLLAGRRYVDVHVSYFDLDHTATRQVEVAATLRGLKSPAMTPVEYRGMFIDRAQLSVPELPRR